MNQDQIVYRKINLIFAGILTGVFIYSGIFACINKPPVVPSFYQLLTGEGSISTGLSRSFVYLMKLDLSAAIRTNRYGPSLFVFFLIQLCLRLFLYSFVKKDFYTVKEILTVDLILTIGMFIFFFSPFIRDTF